MRRSKTFILLILLSSLLWLDAAQAFSFCFSFGSANNRRADYYRGPPVPVWLPADYPAYPYSPVQEGRYGVQQPALPDVPANRGVTQWPPRYD